MRTPRSSPAPGGSGRQQVDAMEDRHSKDPTEAAAERLTTTSTDALGCFALIRDGTRRVAVAIWDAERLWWRLIETDDAGRHAALLDVYAGPAPREKPHHQRSPQEWAINAYATRVTPSTAAPEQREPAA